MLARRLSQGAEPGHQKLTFQPPFIHSAFPRRYRHRGQTGLAHMVLPDDRPSEAALIAAGKEKLRGTEYAASIQTAGRSGGCLRRRLGAAPRRMLVVEQQLTGERRLRFG